MRRLRGKQDSFWQCSIIYRYFYFVSIVFLLLFARISMIHIKVAVILKTRINQVWLRPAQSLGNTLILSPSSDTDASLTYSKANTVSHSTDSDVYNSNPNGLKLSFAAMRSRVIQLVLSTSPPRPLRSPLMWIWICLQSLALFVYLCLSICYV